MLKGITPEFMDTLKKIQYHEKQWKEQSDALRRAVERREKTDVLAVFVYNYLHATDNTIVMLSSQLSQLMVKVERMRLDLERDDD